MNAHFTLIQTNGKNYDSSNYPSIVYVCWSLREHSDGVDRFDDGRGSSRGNANHPIIRNDIDGKYERNVKDIQRLSSGGSTTRLEAQ